MFRNVASQKIQLFAFDTTTGAPKTGDAANITAYVSKDHGTVTVLGDTSATEMDSTNAKGVYVFDLTQAETNADELTFTAKSSTANISITPRFISTVPPKFTTLVIDSAGLVDANAVKVGPSGSGTAQTARDIGASVIAASVTGNVGGNVVGSVGSVTARVTANTDQLAGQTVTAGAGVTFPASIASPTNITAASGVALTSAYDAAKTAAQAGDAMTLTSGERTSVAAAIWNALTSGLTTVGSIGKLLVDNINATISSRLASASYTAPLDAAGVRSAVGLASADLDTQLSGIQSDTNDLQTQIGTAGAGLTALGDTRLAHLDADVSSVGGGSLTVQDIVDGVLNEATASHQTAGTVGKAITDAQSAGDPMQGTAETGFTYGDLIRLLAAYAMGKTDVVKTGNKTATVTFRAVDDSADRIVGTVVGSERTSVTLTP